MPLVGLGLSTLRSRGTCSQSHSLTAGWKTPGLVLGRGRALFGWHREPRRPQQGRVTCQGARRGPRTGRWRPPLASAQGQGPRGRPLCSASRPGPKQPTRPPPAASGPREGGLHRGAATSATRGPRPSSRVGEGSETVRPGGVRVGSVSANHGRRPRPDGTCTRRGQERPELRSPRRPARADRAFPPGAARPGRRLGGGERGPEMRGKRGGFSASSSRRAVGAWGWRRWGPRAAQGRSQRPCGSGRAALLRQDPRQAPCGSRGRSALGERRGPHVGAPTCRQASSGPKVMVPGGDEVVRRRPQIDLGSS